MMTTKGETNNDGRAAAETAKAAVRVAKLAPAETPSASDACAACKGARMVAGGKTCPDCFGTGVSA